MRRYILIASLMTLSMAIVGEAGFRNRNFASDGVGADGRQAVETAMKGYAEALHNTSDQWGTYRQTAGERGKAKQTFQGRYAAIWHLDKDGHWRLFRLMMQPL